MTGMKRRRRINWEAVNFWGPLVLSVAGVSLSITALILIATT